MCFGTLVARGIRKIRFNQKEERTKPELPQRDEEEVAKRKAILERKARRPEKVEKRERRKKTKREKEGMKNLRRLGFIY